MIWQNVHNYIFALKGCIYQKNKTVIVIAVLMLYIFYENCDSNNFIIVQKIIADCLANFGLVLCVY